MNTGWGRVLYFPQLHMDIDNSDDGVPVLAVIVDVATSM